MKKVPEAPTLFGPFFVLIRPLYYKNTVKSSLPCIGF